MNHLLRVAAFAFGLGVEIPCLMGVLSISGHAQPVGVCPPGLPANALCGSFEGYIFSAPGAVAPYTGLRVPAVPNAGNGTMQYIPAPALQGIPQPVVNGACLVGVNNQATWVLPCPGGGGGGGGGNCLLINIGSKLLVNTNSCLLIK